MDPATVVLGGITVAVISSAVTRAVTDKRKVDDNQCKERREGCSHHLCTELAHIKKDQEEMKADIKRLLDRP